MVIEALIGGVTVTVVASLSFARFALKHTSPNALKLRAIAEKRRVHERNRAEWLSSNSTAKTKEAQQFRNAEIEKADAALLALADEEAALAREEDDV
jgi:hypothetical protein